MSSVLNKSITVKSLDPREYFYGHKACAGCGGSLAVRLALKVSGSEPLRLFPLDAWRPLDSSIRNWRSPATRLFPPFPARPR